MSLDPQERSELFRQALELAAELKIASAARHTETWFPIVLGVGLMRTVHVTRHGAHVKMGLDGPFVERFPGRRASGVLQYLRNMAELRDVERLAEKLG